MKRTGAMAIGLVVLALVVVAARGDKDRPRGAKLKEYQTSYYNVQTDLPLESVREISVRMTAMAEEYHRRTKGFSGTIRKRMDFQVFSNPLDYYRAGGMPGSIGMYDGRRLMAMALGEKTWHIVQHEGFHQFAHRAIGGDLPIWVNEGLAEYFGIGIWTGDGFVTGLIPPDRLDSIQGYIRGKQLVGFEEMLEMSHQAWAMNMSTRNYDQAWSMTHFLVHGDQGKYRDAFASFINDVSKGRSPKGAFARRFGRNIEGFQEKYSKWYLALDEKPTQDLYDQATVQTLTSFLARAHTLELEFESAQDLMALIAQGKTSPDDLDNDLWLPQSLARSALRQAGDMGAWSLGEKGNLPTLILTQPDGTKLTGSFKFPKRDEVQIEVQTAEPPKKADKKD